MHTVANTKGRVAMRVSASMFLGSAVTFGYFAATRLAFIYKAFPQAQPQQPTRFDCVQIALSLISYSHVPNNRVCRTSPPPFFQYST